MDITQKKRLQKIASILVKVADKSRGPSETNVPDNMNPAARKLWRLILRSEKGKEAIFSKDSIKEQWRIAEGLWLLLCKRKGIEPYKTPAKTEPPPVPKPSQRIIDSVKTLKKSLIDEGYNIRHKVYRFFVAFVNELNKAGYQDTQEKE